MTPVVWLALTFHLILGLGLIVGASYLLLQALDDGRTDRVRRRIETEQARDDLEAFKWDRDRRRIQAERERRG